MRHQAVKTFALPGTGNELVLQQVDEKVGDEIKEGCLVEPSSNRVVPIRNFIPRFVDDGSYRMKFGWQWESFRQLQIDRINGTTISAKRFYAGTGWASEELRGQRILEVGCGAGRFTQVMLDAGAEVWSLDYSNVVDACWTNHGPHPKLTLVQGDVYAMPFKRGFFDKVFCFGVLQYTPDVKRAFMSLIDFLKPGGQLAVDVYRKEKWPSRWTSKYLWRPLTKRMPEELVFRIVKWYMPWWLPIDNTLDDIPFVRRFTDLIRGVVPCWNYTGALPLTEKQIMEWAILDTFNSLSPKYDQPQTIGDLRSWFEEVKLSDVDVHYGSNGIVGTARKAA
jgi:SAM-dependent methyltransferase